MNDGSRKITQIATIITLALSLGLVWGFRVAAAPPPRPSWATSSLTITLAASRDNTLFEHPTGALSSGAGEHLFAGRTGQGNNSLRRGLIAFDLSSIPTGSKIISVSLKLNMSMTIAGSQSITLYRVLAGWGQGASATGGGQGAPATAGDTTWLHRVYSATLWTTPGGDFSPAARASSLVGGVGVYRWSAAQMVTDVQGWLDQPATNFGWLLRGNENTSGTAKRFDSRENGVGSNRPSLIVSYIPPSVYLPIVFK